MSSPHVGGDFIHMFAAKGVNINSSKPASGRSTPTMGASPARSIHRSIPAQLAHPRGRPQLIAGSIGGKPVGGADSDDDDEADANRAGGVGWRPITPSRTGANSSPRAASSVPQSGVLNPRAFPPSSRAHAEDEAGLQMHMTGRLPAIDPDGQLLADCYNDDGTAAGTSDVTEGGVIEEKTVRFADLPPVLKGYLLGQIACVVKFGVWWVGFTYLILALFGGSGYLVGGTRICFNGALLICSPMAGGIAERTNIKKLLNKTVLFRGIIYVLAIPLAWVLMESGLLWAEHTPLHIAFFVVFLLIIFLDGIGVSFSNVADIDSGGVNLVAAQYGIEIDDNIRNYFNSLHIMFFDLSMVIFNPLLAYVGLLVGQHAVTGNDSVKNVVDEMTLLIAIGGVFFFSTLVTLICYNVYMPDLGEAPKNAAPADGVQSLQTFDPNNNLSVNGGGLDQSFGAPDPSVASGAVATAEPEPFSWAAFKELASSVREGGALTWANTRIRYRVLFFAVETSVEDAMIALIAAEIGSEVFASSQSGDDDLHYAYGNLWGAGLVAVGKSGGVLASMLMHRYFRVDEVAESLNPGRAYKPLFWFAFIGGVCSLILPVSYWMRRHQVLDSVYTTAIMFVAMFLFFLFSTLSKIGFSTLMQSMAAEVEATGRVFGFVAAFVTATDALILMGMAALFSSLDLQLALWIATAFIATHGLVELLFGPALVLKPGAKSLDDQFAQDLAQPLM